MDDTQIHITVNKGFIERLIYWIIILVLAILLIWQVLKDDTTESTATQTTETETTTQTAVTAPTAAPAASCTDAVKNQDETGIDCGGSCTKCALGIACKTNADCISSICSNSTCVATAPVVLSNKMEVDVTSVGTTSAASGAEKVNTITYKIKNGLAEDAEGFIAKVFIKNKANTRCMNQQESGVTCDDAYAEFMIGPVKSGATFTETHTFADDEYTTRVGRYIVDDTGENPSQYNVLMYLYDEDGNEINDKTVSDTYAVS